MKILVIFTGGTIGSTVSGEYISTDGKKPYIILDKYNKEFSNSIEWHTESPYTILSENATIDTYRMLAKSVKAGLSKDYDGIIVTHGSDTLQYSAAFLSLILGDDVAPVMLVSSNYVLEDERANGMDNFGAAVDFIINQRGRGVFVPYKNVGEEVKVHRGKLLMPHVPYSDYLYSLSESYYEKETPYEEPDYEAKDMGIVVVHAMPGFSYPRLTKEVRAVLLQAYHGGTFCVADENFRAFVKETQELGISVNLVGANPETDYDSCKEYEKLGIKVLKHLSPIYAYMRLWVSKWE